MSLLLLAENLACDECGRYGAIDLPERKICPACYEAYGSCCPELEREETTAGSAD